MMSIHEAMAAVWLAAATTLAPIDEPVAVAIKAETETAASRSRPKQ